MLTKNEVRVLYVLTKEGGRARHSTMTRAMQRIPTQARDIAISNCEGLELISSAKTPPATGKAGGGRGGGPGGLVYWLTAEGKEYAALLIRDGRMKDPKLEPRAGKGSGRRVAG